MRQRLLMTRRSMLFSLVGLMLTTMLTIWGCGGSDSTGSGSYSDPTQQVVTTTVTRSGNALVEADELKAWMDEGKVNAPLGNYDRVVILDVGNSTYASTGHIPGAQDIAAGSSAFIDNARAEGPFNITGQMVCGGKQMDALIQAAGIDGNTTIVIAGGNTTNIARAYTTLRYWGFDKKRLKVLQGGQAAWTTAGYELTKAIPKITPSSFAVAPAVNYTRVNTDMRVSLAEMIAYVKGIAAGNPNNVVILDNIRPATHVTNTTDLIDPGNTPMEGAIKGSYRLPSGSLVTAGLYWKDAATLQTDISNAPDFQDNPMGDAKRNTAKVFITQCRAGNAASVGFFAVDGIAYYNSNVDVKWYDGSYGQWNLLVSKDKVGTGGLNAGGQLAVGSIWETTSLMDNLTYNVDLAKPVVEYANRVYAVEPSFVDGNQVESEDSAYRSAVTDGGGSAGGGASAGGGC